MLLFLLVFSKQIAQDFLGGIAEFVVVLSSELGKGFLGNVCGKMRSEGIGWVRQDCDHNPSFDHITYHQIYNSQQLLHRDNPSSRLCDA